MSMAPRVDRAVSQAAPAAEALYFESSGQTLFGWLHWPDTGKRSDLGLVICKPFGFEGICAHRSVRAFAEACAMRGVPSLRFDYLGTGDSADIDPAADQMEIWTADVVAAAHALQQRAGVSRICLFGIRLGALLAGLAAHRCAAVDSLILVAPILSGRKYLKEIHVTRLAAGLQQGGGDTASASAGSMEISGFHLSQAAVQSLQQADLASRDAPAGAAMLVIDGSSLPVSRTWTDKLAATGVPVTYHALPGMVEMTFTAPQFAAVPQQMVAAVCAWLPKIAYGTKTLHACFVRPPAQTPPALRLSEGSDDQASITERPVFFGPDAALFGIVTEPRPGERRRRAVLILNAGADFHIGPSGISVELARTWARHGYVVLRMDFAGIGDSITRPGHTDDEVFPQTAVDDMRAAIVYIRGRYDVRDFTVAGMCSGAYHTLQSAIAALPVDRLLMINPQNYFWNERMSIHGMQVAELVAHPARRTRLWSLSLWRRLLSGDIDVAYLSVLYARRVAFVVRSALRNVARSLRIRLSNDLGGELEKIARRGVRIVFVFARGEPGIDLLKMQAGASLKRLGERYRMHILDGADHVFSRLGPRRQLQKILSDELYRLKDSKKLESLLASRADPG